MVLRTPTDQVVRLPDEPVPAYDLDALFRDSETRWRVGELIARGAEALGKTERSH